MLVIIQGVFRSGTTALFEIFRQDERFRCYYEPLHPKLIWHIDDMLSPSPKHPAAKFFGEYAEYRDRVAELFQPRFATDQCALVRRTALLNLRPICDFWQARMSTWFSSLIGRFGSLLGCSEYSRTVTLFILSVIHGR